MALQRSLKHSCRDIGRSPSSHKLLLVSLPNLHWTSRFCIALLRLRHLDSVHNVHSLVLQCGHCTIPHFSTVVGIGRLASSHKMLSTLCVALSSFTMQCALRFWGFSQHSVITYDTQTTSKIYPKSSIHATTLCALRPWRQHPFKFDIFSSAWIIIMVIIANSIIKTTYFILLLTE